MIIYVCVLYLSQMYESFMLYLCSECGEMCAMKEVTLFFDDAKSKESAKQLGQVSIL